MILNMQAIVTYYLSVSEYFKVDFQIQNDKIILSSVTFSLDDLLWTFFLVTKWPENFFFSPN